MTWVEKYRPQSLGDVVGQTNHIRSLREWLESWEDIQVRGNKREVKDVKGWNAAGSINSKAALISGDSGIGKTATARLLAMEYDFNIFEFNTSDALNDIGVNMM
jgi:replication factor C subunit 1